MKRDKIEPVRLPFVVDGLRDERPFTWMKGSGGPSCLERSVKVVLRPHQRIIIRRTCSFFLTSINYQCIVCTIRKGTP